MRENAGLWSVLVAGPSSINIESFVERRIFGDGAVQASTSPRPHEKCPKDTAISSEQVLYQVSRVSNSPKTILL